MTCVEEWIPSPAVEALWQSLMIESFVRIFRWRLSLPQHLHAIQIPYDFCDYLDNWWQLLYDLVINRYQLLSKSVRCIILLVSTKDHQFPILQGRNARCLGPGHPAVRRTLSSAPCSLRVLSGSACLEQSHKEVFCVARGKYALDPSCVFKMIFPVHHICLGLPERQRSNLSPMDPDSAREHPIQGQECNLRSCSNWTVRGAGNPFWQKYRLVSVGHWNPYGSDRTCPVFICLSKKHLSQVCIAMPAVSAQMRLGTEANARFFQKMPTVCLVVVTTYFSPLSLRKIVFVKWIVLIRNSIKIILSS